ncbi:hypothetical protein [Streptacidiphilus sp. EB103A]|uniref:hypothetical protein n=1 Tax=Streptacidiphilus sp. EB103A TaxID=3156275 RepID=UPI0035157787
MRHHVRVISGETARLAARSVKAEKPADVVQAGARWLSELLEAEGFVWVRSRQALERKAAVADAGDDHRQDIGQIRGNDQETLGIGLGRGDVQERDEFSGGGQRERPCARPARYGAAAPLQVRTHPQRPSPQALLAAALNLRRLINLGLTRTGNTWTLIPATP